MNGRFSNEKIKKVVDLVFFFQLTRTGKTSSGSDSAYEWAAITTACQHISGEIVRNCIAKHLPQEIVHGIVHRIARVDSLFNFFVVS
jgi:hypothetical protein